MVTLSEENEELLHRDSSQVSFRACPLKGARKIREIGKDVVVLALVVIIIFADVFATADAASVGPKKYPAPDKAPHYNDKYAALPSPPGFLRNVGPDSSSILGGTCEKRVSTQNTYQF